MKTAFVSCVLFASLIPAFTRLQAGSDFPAPTPCDNLIAHEPVLLFELAGTTLIAQYDRTLTVYADGALKLADASTTGPGQAIRAQTTPEVVNALKSALTQAGAAALCDDARGVTDVPLRTVTLLRGAQDARAHTFSYWLADGEYAQVDALIEGFIAEHFAQ